MDRALVGPIHRWYGVRSTGESRKDYDTTTVKTSVLSLLNYAARDLSEYWIKPAFTVGLSDFSRFTDPPFHESQAVKR